MVCYCSALQSRRLGKHGMEVLAHSLKGELGLVLIRFRSLGTHPVVDLCG